MADWTRKENDLIVADYFSMLNDELVGKSVNKTRTREALLPLLNNRSNGSVEFKRQNISAWLIELGLPFIRGYLPRANKQGALLEAILDYLQSRKDEVEIKFKKFSDEDAYSNPALLDFADFIDDPPNIQDLSEPKVAYRTRLPFKVNYLEREQRNSSLGEKGELLVIAYERWRLEQAGKQNLVDQIKWISKEDDGAGFDILSKNLNGTDKYIEVKTTKLSKESPFFFSKTEYNFSKEKAAN